MAIQNSEIKVYKAITNNETSANGGRRSNNLITSNVRNNLFPNVSQTERTDGTTKRRKIFYRVENDDDLTLYNAKYYFKNTSGADDYFVFYVGTNVDTQADLGSPRIYGTGILESNITAGDTTLTVELEVSSVADIANLAIFNTAISDNKIFISDGTHTEYFSAVTASKADNIYTLTLNAGDTIAYNYSTSDTYIGSYVDLGDITTSYTTPVVTSTSGTFDDTTYPILLDNIGTIYDTWTLTFTNATTYTIAGTNTGLLSSGGNISSNASPINSIFNKKYFTIQSSAFDETFTTGDTIIFTTYPAEFSIWIREIVPANSSSYSNNTLIDALIGESA